jgi:hypothetical protein
MRNTSKWVSSITNTQVSSCRRLLPESCSLVQTSRWYPYTRSVREENMVTIEKRIHVIPLFEGRASLISVLRPLIYSLNPSRDKMAGNQKCGWLRLPHVTGPIISQGRVWLYSVWGSMVRVCMGRASTFVWEPLFDFNLILLSLKYI